MPARRAVLLSLALLAFAVLWLVLTASSDDVAGERTRRLFGLWRARNFVVGIAACWLALALPFLLRPGRARTRFVVLHASLAFVWGMLELAGALGVVSYPRLVGNQPREQLGTRRVPHHDVRGLAREDLADAWKLEREPIEFHFQTDRHGFRNAPDREHADVYCLGDSFLVAGLVPQDQFLPPALEQRLGRSVMGVALVGLSPQAERELLLESKLPLDGRLVLHFVFEGNDLLDSANWRGVRKRATQSWTEHTLANQLVLKLQFATQKDPAFVKGRAGRIGNETYYFGWLRSSFEGLEGELAPIAETLSKLRGEIEAAGGRYAVVIIPDKLRVLGPACAFPPESEVGDWRTHCGPIPDSLAAWSAREGVPVLDLTEPLRASVAKGEVPWFPADTHWNATGHRVAAETIAAWEPVRAWAGAPR